MYQNDSPVDVWERKRLVWIHLIPRESIIFEILRRTERHLPIGIGTVGRRWPALVEKVLKASQVLLETPSDF